MENSGMTRAFRSLVLSMAAIAAIVSMCGCNGPVKAQNSETRSPKQNVIASSDGNVVVDMNAGDDPDPVQETDTGVERAAFMDYEDELTQVYKSQVGVREKSGRNDGRDVEMYLRSTGLPKGNPWCAAFVHWCMEQAGVPNKINASSGSAYSKSKVSFKGGKWKREFRPGQVFTLYYQNLGRIGHTGFVDDLDGSVAMTVEGNTNVAGSREGDGVYKKRRPLNGMYAICDWYPRK
jgi:CHAP domain